MIKTKRSYLIKHTTVIFYTTKHVEQENVKENKIIADCQMKPKQQRRVACKYPSQCLLVVYQW